jgi:nucleotide-binding universal stress UspA family protein
MLADLPATRLPECLCPDKKWVGLLSSQLFLYRYLRFEYASPMFKHILVPVDGSDCALAALEVGARFAREQQARLTVCTVVDPAKAAAMAFGEATMAAACLDALDEEGKALVHDAVSRVQSIWSAEAAVVDGAPVDSIVEYTARCGADLVIIGSHGRSGLQRLFLGSVAEGVVRNVSVPVMVVRHVAIANDETDKVSQAFAAAPKAATTT